jgi:Ice-binding-like/Bacterial Ig-like domain
MRKFRLCFTYCLAALLIVFVVGCGQETVTVPSVVSTVPANGATNVSVNTPISATFSMPMRPTTLTSATFTVTGPGGAVAGAVTYSGTTATFAPSAALAYGTVYTATITNGATDLGGTPIFGNYVWTFTTITPTPVVVSTIPANGATNVSVSQVISATFNETMNSATINGSTFTVNGPGGAVAGTIAYSGVTATFTPTAALAYNTVYTATITTGAEDLAGAPLAANYVWTFTTITPPPIVIATIPVNGATGVPVTQVITAVFNEAMNCASLASPATSFVLSGPGTTPVAGTVGCAGAVATFTPTTNLAVNTIYTATITTGAQDLAGTPLGGNYVWTFRTVPGSAPPVVIFTIPTNGATGVPINQSISATFSEAMNPSTISGTTFTLSGPGNVAVTGTVTYIPAGSVATFTPTANLALSTTYTATITTGATNLAGTAVASNYTWSFTTAATATSTAPTVILTIPLNGATAVPVNQTVSATFSEGMNPTTINSNTFMLTGPGTTAVPGLVSYAAIGNTLIFTPSANLAPNTLFTATITTGVEDLAGNALAADYVWTFTTGTNVLMTAPEIVSTVPVNAATNVPLNQTVSATFTEAMNPLSITTATFQLTGPGGTALAGTVSYDALNFIATFTPAAPLLTNSSYTATLTTGVTDLEGNPLGNSGAPNPWMFTTGAAAGLGPIPLGSASTFGSFGGTAGITNQGIFTVINGDIGTTGVSTLVTGFHDETVVVAGVAECVYTETPLNVGLVNGVIETAPPPPAVGCPNEGTAATYAIAAKAALDALAAYNALVAIPGGLDVSTCPGCGGGSAGELGNRTLEAGVYKAAPGSYAISMGDLTLDAKGDANAVWVFQMATTLTVGTPTSNRSILLVNGAKAANVYWQVGSAATINGILGGGTMQGTVISQDGVAVSTAGVVDITTWNGRALVLTGPVTVVNTVINVP